MSVMEKTGTDLQVEIQVKKSSGTTFFTQFINLISSVRLGIILLILVTLCCLFGMLIMQQNVQGFERYYADLTPSQKLVYGKAGLFDIYNAWYFKTLLFALALNIILSSIDRFPKTWTFISKPKLIASPKWLRGQSQSAELEFEGTEEEITRKIEKTARKIGWKKTAITGKKGQTYVFAQSGVWNRLGAYPVHVALLTIIIGGYMTTQLGNTGQMVLSPGQTSNRISETVFELDKIRDVTKALPFEVTCTDIQQKLIKNDGAINAMNTIDWMTRIKIKDETGTHEAVVQMNRPVDYRGYRFFQSSFVPVGRARSIAVRATPANGGAAQDITIQRDGTASLADGTQIKFANFRGNFNLAKEDPNEDTSSYPNPAAVLQVTPPNGETQTAYAFGEKMSGIPMASKPIAGYTFQLTDFEKVGDQHILSVQRDPGATVVYVGFLLLCITLVAVFFFSHQRVWAAVEKVSENNFRVTFGGNTNRNQTAFDERFKQFVKSFSAV